MHLLTLYASEPQTDGPCIRKLTASQLWPVVFRIAGKIRIPNLNPEPHFLKWNKHFCQAHAIYIPEAHRENVQPPVSSPPRPPVHPSTTKHSANVSFDPDNTISEQSLPHSWMNTTTSPTQTSKATLALKVHSKPE